jgi:two-component system sensor histidine kinase FlrB
LSIFDFIEDIAESVEGFLLEKGTPLEIISDIFDLDFEGDEQKLRIALINLIKNASESSTYGSPIELRLSQDASYLHISVKDYGQGISKELLPTIFEPFATTKSYGTGLGLPIVKKTIESHDGTISIQSAEGAGTTFTIHLPLPKEKSTDC